LLGATPPSDPNAIQTQTSISLRCRARISGSRIGRQLVAQGERDIAAVAEVAHSGDTGSQRRRRRDPGLGDELVVGGLRQEVDDSSRCVHHQVLVGVYQTRKQGDACAQVDELGVRGRRGRVLDGHHPAPLDKHVGP
jgi:hypothetical protein